MQVVLSLFGVPQANTNNHFRGRATVDLFVLHGARIVVLDREGPATPFTGEVVLATGSVRYACFLDIYPLCIDQSTYTLGWIWLALRRTGKQLLTSPFTHMALPPTS